MYQILLEEFTSILPNTPAQNARIARAVADYGNWRFEDASELYQESAVRVWSKGHPYVVFAAGEFGSCTCADYRERALVKSEIVACKHVIGAYACGQFTVQPDAEATPSSEEGEGPIDWRNAEPIGWEYIPGVGEVPLYAEEVVEAYGLSVCNN